MSEQIKKIVLAMPHTGTLPTDVVLSLLKIQSKYAINIQMLKSSILYISRENLVEISLKSEADYIMFLDSDQIIESNTIDTMANYLDNGEDIVTALIFRKDSPYQPCIFSEQKELENRQISLKYYDVFNQDLTKPFYVESCGLGCAMIKLDVFKNIRQPWFLPRPYTGEDISFMWEVRQKGYKILCDPTLEIGHIGTKNFNRQDYFNIIKKNNDLLNGSVTPEVYL